MIRLIFVILFVALYLIIGIPILFVEWLVSKKFRYAADISQLRMVQWAFKVILILSGVHLTVIGEENVPKDTPVLYVGNHRSFFDIIITYARCPRLTGYVAKDSMLKVPLLSLWMKRLYCLFLNRSDVKEGLKTILTGIDQIKHGISMCIFPEGTRSKDGKVGRGKTGVALIAARSGAAVVPAGIVFEGKLRFRSKVTVKYGKPIAPEDIQLEKELDPHKLKAVKVKIMGEIKELVEGSNGGN